MTVDITNLHKASAQDVFDTISTHLLKQGKKASYKNTHGTDICCYRQKVGDEILRCAAGCLIPDSLYNPEVEGWSWSTYKDSKPSDICELLKIPHHKELIRRLQVVHDSHPVKNWPDELANLAKEFCLSFNKPSEVN